MLLHFVNFPLGCAELLPLDGGEMSPLAVCARVDLGLLGKDR